MLTICSYHIVVCVVIADGLVKTDAPGSLWQPATTHLFPKNWLALPLAYGLMASPWGAHSVFPSVSISIMDLFRLEEREGFVSNTQNRFTATCVILTNGGGVLPLLFRFLYV